MTGERYEEELRELLLSEPETIQRSVIDVAVERITQPDHGWTMTHDDEHGYGHLIRLAKDRLERAYTMGDMGADEQARVQLVKAAALAVAGIDVIDRAAGRV